MVRSPPRHVLVTGSSRGIGRAVAAAFVAAGDHVTVHARSLVSAEAARAELGAAAAIAADVTDAESFAAALRSADPVDVLVNNAGGVETAPLAKLDIAQLRRMMALNLEPVLTAIATLAPGMTTRGGGRIVTVASMASLKGYAYVGAYTAAKHAVLGLVRALALELAGDGITVNAVCPGYTDTPLIAASLDRLERRTGRDRDALLAEFTRVNPLGRLIRPDEVAAAIMFLASPAASGITGQALPVSGGEA